VAPKRPLLIVAGLIAAIGAGLALALLPHLFAPTFGDTETLARKMGLPVIGSVSSILTEQERLRRQGSGRRAVFAATALVALAGILAAVGPLGMKLLRDVIT